MPREQEVDDRGEVHLRRRLARDPPQQLSLQTKPVGSLSKRALRADASTVRFPTRPTANGSVPAGVLPRPSPLVEAAGVLAYLSAVAALLALEAPDTANVLISLMAMSLGAGLVWGRARFVVLPLLFFGILELTSYDYSFDASAAAAAAGAILAGTIRGPLGARVLRWTASRRATLRFAAIRRRSCRGWCAAS